MELIINPMKILVRPGTKFKVGLGISRTNADSQWNPAYNAFHRIFCCGNETIRQ